MEAPLPIFPVSHSLNAASVPDHRICHPKFLVMRVLCIEARIVENVGSRHEKKSIRKFWQTTQLRESTGYSLRFDYWYHSLGHSFRSRTLALTLMGVFHKFVPTKTATRDKQPSPSVLWWCLAAAAAFVVVGCCCCCVLHYQSPRHICSLLVQATIFSISLEDIGESVRIEHVPSLSVAPRCCRCCNVSIWCDVVLSKHFDEMAHEDFSKTRLEK